MTKLMLIQVRFHKFSFAMQMKTISSWLTKFYFKLRVLLMVSLLKEKSNLPKKQKKQKLQLKKEKEKKEENQNQRKFKSPNPLSTS